MGHDLWFAIRRLRLRPVYSLVIALTLGLGIGSALAVFAVVDAVLLRPLPYPESGRLVRITQTVPAPGLPELGFSDVGYRRLVSDGHSLSAVAAWGTGFTNLIRGDGSRRLIVAQVSASLFDVLRVAPALGRRFTAGEDLPNGPRLLVLSDQLWRSVFNADPAVIGTVVNLEGEPSTIVGVLPPGVTFGSRQIAAWEPLRLDPAGLNPYNHGYSVVGRLKAGTGLEAARRDLTLPVRAVGREFPGPHAGSVLDPSGYLAQVHPLADSVVGDVRPVVALLLVGVLLLLLLTCANVANLQLAGVIVRGEELAVRAALGATRGRLIRGALLEGIILSAAGAGIGLAIAGLGSKLMVTLLPAGIASAAPLLGIRTLVAAAVAVLVVGAVVGALPVAVAAGRDPASSLRARAAGTPAANALRRILAAAQIGLAVLLLHGSGLLLASAREVQRVPLGFNPGSALSLRINLPTATLRDRTARESLLRRLITAVGQLPGVTAAGLVNALPLTPGREDLAMAVEGRPFKADGTDPIADYRVVSHDYFAAMQIGLRHGRLFGDDDASARITPVVISEGLARRLFPDGEDPLGRRLRFGPVSPWMPIVAVVADARNRSLTDEPRPELYLPGLGSWASMGFATEITIVARASGDPLALAGPIRRIITEAAPDIAIYNQFTLDAIVRDAGARMAITTRLMSGYALAALLLALAGTYAVLSFLVTQRERELAVRIALGAKPGEIVKLVGRESLLVVGASILIGLAGTLSSARLLAGLLYGVGPFNLGVLGLVVLGAVLTGVIGAMVPAWRATRIDPIVALRSGG